MRHLRNVVDLESDFEIDIIDEHDEVPSEINHFQLLFTYTEKKKFVRI